MSHDLYFVVGMATGGFIVWCLAMVQIIKRGL